MRKLKKVFLVILIMAALFAAWVEIANRNSKNMTYRQKVLKTVYPAFMWFNKLIGNRQVRTNDQAADTGSFYTLSITLNNGKTLSFAELKGKKILLVNTASNCGFTDQYAELQQLSERMKDKLVVIGFPANDFKEQEKGSDEQIAQFCQLNYGVSFPLAKKSSVVKGPDQNLVYQWLTDPSKNGWNKKQPEWNFSKYLVDENGVLKGYYSPSYSPLSREILDALK